MELFFSGTKIVGEVVVPGDKSISHRALMLAAVSHGRSIIEGFLLSEDCLATLQCLRQMGVSIEREGSAVLVEGVGWHGLKQTDTMLDVGNSGTTIRLLAGLLAGNQGLNVQLSGDSSIARRPMLRVVAPLRQMGAVIGGQADGNYAPLVVKGKALHGIHYLLPVASAQVKSAVILAGLQATGETVIIEPVLSRDHTELMIKQFGGHIERVGHEIRVGGGQDLYGCQMSVPGDISSAAFWFVAAAIVPDSEITVRGVGLNPTRSGILDVLTQMGADIEVLVTETSGELVGDVTVRYSALRGITIDGAIIPRLIDELPVIALLATQAKGTTIVRDAREMRVKETDRIALTTKNLQCLGARIIATEDGFVIEGGTVLAGGEIDSYGDHRLGMMAAIASLVTKAPVELANPEVVNVSYPGFFETFDQIRGGS